jgi:uncharacterized protein YjiS (DUF1127 family)
MQDRRQTIFHDKLSAGPGAALFDLMRRRRARNRNLEELRALDRLRLQDIGLSERERARLLHADQKSLSSNTDDTDGKELYAACGLGAFMLPSIRVSN